MLGRTDTRSWSRLVAGIAAVALASGLALAAGSTAATTEKKATTASSAAKIDINAASKAELATLPGIGDAYSQKIIDGRPYKSKAELESKKILPKGVYDKIAPLIIAHQK
jgi:DNA uptake protein ComE-like DNA-binding protein